MPDLNKALALFCGAACTIFAASLITEQLYVTTKRETLRFLSLPDSAEGMRIVHLSDTHIGKGHCLLSELTARAVALKPDAFVITGDVVSRYILDFSDYIRFISKLLRVAPVMLSLGNHEGDLSVEQRLLFNEINEALGVTCLDNADITLRGIRFCGFTLNQDCYLNEYGYGELAKTTVNELVEAFGEKKGFTVLLAHNPLSFETYAEWGAELVLAGHIHGGIIRLPGGKGLLSPERRFFPKYCIGAYQQGNTQMRVSSGLSKLRAFNPMEIREYTLRGIPKKPSNRRQ